jgi:hypothetical protein
LFLSRADPGRDSGKCYQPANGTTRRARAAVQQRSPELSEIDQESARHDQKIRAISHRRLRSASGVPAVPNDVRSSDLICRLQGYLSATHKFDLIRATSRGRVLHAKVVWQKNHTTKESTTSERKIAIKDAGLLNYSQECHRVHESNSGLFFSGGGAICTGFAVLIWLVLPSQ